MNDGGRGQERAGGESDRFLCWDPKLLNRLKSTQPQVQWKVQVVTETSSGGSLVTQALFFTLLDGFWVPHTNRTGCNRPWDFLFCLLRWLAHVLLKFFSETTRRKQIPRVFGKTAWNLLWHFSMFLSPLCLPPWADAVPSQQWEELHATAKIHVEKGHPLGVTSALGVESKISLCPLQITSYKKPQRIAYLCKICEWGYFSVIAGTWSKQRK